MVYHTILKQAVSIPRIKMPTIVTNSILSDIEALEKDINAFIDEVEPIAEQRFVMMSNKKVWFDKDNAALFPKFEYVELPQFSTEFPLTCLYPGMDFEGFHFVPMTCEECRKSFLEDSGNPYIKKMFLSTYEYFDNYYLQRGNMGYYTIKEKVRNDAILTGDVTGDGGSVVILITGQMMGYKDTTPYVLVPICRLDKKDSDGMGSLDAILSWLKHGLIPEGLSEESNNRYRDMIGIAEYMRYDRNENVANNNRIIFDVEKFTDDVLNGRFTQTVFDYNLGIAAKIDMFTRGEKTLTISADKICDIFLKCDTIRANIQPYEAKYLTYGNLGHWELVETASGKDTVVNLPIGENFVARPPQMDVRESGICAIDFGTKSTVVVCRNREERLLRVGKTDYRKTPTMEDYENPTAIELRDIKGFLSAYNAREGRPFTEWEQITVSHQALDRLMQNEGHSIYQSVFSELKQWANEKNGVRRLRDQKEVDVLLPAYEKLGKDDFDPIEIYAYYLGLYINNMVNGIYLEYILSFPVNYEKSIRERLRDSFEQGIKKSLPPAILRDDEFMEDFRVYAGASEPAAYASCALKELGKTNPAMRPTEKQPIYYGVFDFGGGTTDFDYGIWRLPTPEDKGSHNFVIEHFHAGGDVHLGGEKLLNILAYEVYQANIDIMRKEGITFALPDNCEPFVGWEMLLTESDAAYLNRRRLSELLRPIWEEKPEHENMGKEPQEVQLYRDSDMVSVQLRIDVAALKDILRQRIKQGVESFFVGLLNAFRNEPVPVFDILMAGNSCKSKIVQELFQEEMQRREEEIKIASMESQGQEKDFRGIFRLHLPLGSGEQKSERNFDRIPTGKTGVAFGLLDCRKGGHDVLVIDRNLSAEKESPFRYYLGYSDRADKFHVLISKGVGYQEWVPFFYTDDDRFEVYYSSESRALGNQMDITEVPAPKKCRIHYFEGHEEGMIYLRKVAPNRIEYTVAGEDGIEGEEYWAKVESCELGE